MNDLQDILGRFNIQPNNFAAERYGDGHIHDTFLIKTYGVSPDYLLQKINHHVFPDVHSLMQNMIFVLQHLNTRVASGSLFKRNNYLTVLFADTRLPYLHYKEKYWRLFEFIPESFTYQKPENTKQAYEAGKMTGWFQGAVNGMRNKLTDIIPDFHNLDKRIEQFREACSLDPLKRLAGINDELLFIQEQVKEIEAFTSQVKNGVFPLRITHNDTKFNNFLFDEDDHCTCLIDLDTVMPGYAFYDFGDAIRILACSTDEDERDLAKVSFMKEYYEAFLRGYLEEAEAFLTEKELEWLPMAPVYMTLMIGLRFLTDFINGDIYFKTNYPEHNLVRARCQFEFLKKIKG